MKLLLTSSGITNKSIENALSELAEKPFSKLNLTFIPTAANIEEGNKSWLVDDMYNFKKLDFASFDVMDISAVPKDIWRPSFEKANILVFGGGNVNYLLGWIRKSGLKEMLPELLKTKVYVGISAGSRAIGSGLLLSHVSKAGKGLKIVDFGIVPHINSKHFPERTFKRVEKESRKISYPIYAIDDSTAVKVVDNQIDVVSEGQWKKFN